MVRRAILDHGETLAAEDQALPPGQFPADPAQQRGQHWHGAGGRWLVWAGRAIAWAVLLLIGYRGVLAIVTGQSAGTAAKSATASSHVTFPVGLGEAYALQFGQVYLNFSPAGAALRAQRLARLAPGIQLGWNGAGTEHVDSEQVAGISVTGPHSAVVTLLASVNASRLLELAVPVYAAGGGMSVYAAPALLPAPGRITAPAPSTAGTDQAIAAQLQSQLPAFFAAYASGDRTTLARFAAPGSHIRGLAGAVSFVGIDAVYAPRGGATRTISVTVTWKLPPAADATGRVASASASAALQMTYQLTVVRRGGSWDVQSVGPIAQGPP